MNIKQLFCKHDYKLIEGNKPVHYPDYKPVKYSQLLECKKCNKAILFFEDEKYDYLEEINEKITEYLNANALETDLITDGYHTFKELYDYRMLYNVLWVNQISKEGKYKVYKTKKHNDGSLCFGGGWFLVTVILPTGIIDNHYEEKYWDLFNCEEIEKEINKYDGHTPKDVLDRMIKFVKENK